MRKKQDESTKRKVLEEKSQNLMESVQSEMSQKSINTMQIDENKAIPIQ
jgi:hypothetical protein